MQRNRTSWFDSYGLLIASLFLLVFIPLYPKIPLFDAIPGYLVRVRLEDILVLCTGLLWLIQLKRNKIIWNTSYFWLVCTYAAIGFLSILSGVLLLQTIPFSPLHLGKSLLHYFRYAEYFSVFFFAYAGITNLRQVRAALWLLGATVITITIYGYGQLYWHWPLFSTMNREFSKGVKLYLTEYARVQSTFAGHYDLAAYLVLVLPLLLSAALLKKNTVERVFFAITHLAGLWLLITSGSNIALAAYFAGTATVLLLFLKRFPKVFRYTMLAAGTATTVFLLIVAGTYFLNPAAPKQIIQLAEQTSVVPKIPGLSLALRTTRVALYPETAPAPNPELKPADVYHDIPELVEVSTVSATGKISTIVVEKDRTWSENAIKYGLSMGIRLDTLWPQAIKGWTRNLYLGSGYGTLNKLGTQEFTEADSTDNNYFRTLGETGVTGFILFAILLILLVRQNWGNILAKNTVVATIAIGIIGSVIGLLANAVIIDVFVASKVAFTFWALAGISAKTVYLANPDKTVDTDIRLLSRARQLLLIHWPVLLAVLLALFLLHKNPLDERSSTRELSVAPNSVVMLSTVACWLETGQWQLCAAYVEEPSSASIIYGILLAPLFAATNNPATFYFINLGLLLCTIGLLYGISQKLQLSQWLQAVSMLGSIVLLFIIGSTGLPVAGNLFLPLTLVVIAIGLHFSRRVALVSGAIVLALFALQSTISIDLLHLFGPLVSLITALCIKYIWLKISFTPKVGSLLIFSSAAISSLLLLYSPAPRSWMQQILEYRAQLPALRAQTVRRANQFFAGKSSEERWTSDHLKPYVLSTIDPLYWHLYGNQLYQPIPLSQNQQYYGQFLQSIGLEQDADASNIYRTLLTDRELYLIDTNSNDPKYAAAFAKLKQDFTVWQIDSDCNEQCNLYEVRTDTPLTPTQPLAINPETKISQVDADFSFISYNHRFNLHDLELTHTTKAFAELIRPTIESKPDIMLLGGDVADKSDMGQKKYFTGGFSDLASFPIVYSPGNYDELETKLYPENYQQFRVGNSLFVLLHPAPDGEIGLQQQLFINNSLLQLEKQPEIKNIFFISHRMGWVAGNPSLEPLQAVLTQPLTTHDSYFAAKLLPKLAKQPEKHFYFVGGDLKANQLTNVFFYQQDNVTYLASAVNNHASDAYLQFVVSDNQVSITPYSGKHEQLNSITEYGAAYWQAKVPELGTYTAAPEASAVQLGLARVGLSIVLGVIVVVGYKKFSRVGK